MAAARSEIVAPGAAADKPRLALENTIVAAAVAIVRRNWPALSSVVSGWARRMEF
jgi:hypothetical protein